MSWPPTLIIVHPRERRSKCSVEPLRGRAGFEFQTFPEVVRPPRDGYVRLGLGGELLSARDRDRGLLVLDGTWKYAARMEADYTDLPVRSLEPWETAYPRKSKTFDDPAAGLATIEAIYAAYLQLGRDPSGLLDDYYWRDSFLAINAVRAARWRGDVAAMPSS